MSRSHGEDCREFLGALSRALEGRPQPEQLVRLSWHEHLLGCSSCRDLLEREEALEVLLATLPEPKLPPDLSRRLVRRLESNPASSLDALLELDDAQVPAGLSGRVREGVARERALDALLDLNDANVPSGLAGRVRAGLERERALDALLDRDVVEVPAGLEGRVLEGLQAELRPRPRFRLLRSPALLAAAAALVLWVVLPGSQEEAPRPLDEVARLDALTVPDPELLEVFEVLERDELWDDQGGVAPDPSDLELLLSETVEVEDELLLAFLEGSGEGSDR